MDKAALLDNISAGYEALEKMLAPLNAETYEQILEHIGPIYVWLAKTK